MELHPSQRPLRFHLKMHIPKSLHCLYNTSVTTTNVSTKNKQRSKLVVFGGAQTAVVLLCICVGQNRKIFIQITGPRKASFG